MKFRLPSVLLLSFLLGSGAWVVHAQAPARPAAEAAPTVITVGEAIKACAERRVVRVRGTFTGEIAPGAFYLQDATGCIRGQLDHPWEVQPGDTIEVTGRAEIWSTSQADRRAGLPGFPFLLNATGKRIGPGRLPEPLAMNPAEAYASQENYERYNSRHVRVRGRITGFDARVTGWKTTWATHNVANDIVMVESGGRTVQVLFPPGAKVRDLLAAGAMVEVDGVCRLRQFFPGDAPSFVEILVAGRDQVRVLEPPPFWTRPGVQQGLKISLAALGGIVALGGAWMLGQRRRLQALRASEEKYRALTQSLEQRVTERTAELDIALAREREVGQLKTNFVSLVTHEFRTPLGVIMAAVEVLRRYFYRLPEEKREEHLDIIFRSTKNLAGLIEEVLLLGRMEDGRLSLAPVPLDLDKLCRTLADELFSATGGTSPIQYQAAAPLHEAIADEAAVRHILTNLISNAVKYSEPGQPVEFTLARQGADAVFTILDHGIGIPLEEQDRIFERFTRASNVGNRPGTGLGLVIVQRCVALHGGSLHLRSVPSSGTTVTVSLPVFPNPSSL